MIRTLSDAAYSILNDESASPQGDLYIRSVCFSPDGKLLATGAEDKQIRVSALRVINQSPPVKPVIRLCNFAPRVTFGLPVISAFILITG